MLKASIKYWVIFSLALFSLNTYANQTNTTPFQLKKTPEVKAPSADRFPDDPAEHKVVFMWDKSDPAYQHHILNSIQALIGLYGSDVKIAVVAIGPGIHVLAKHPKRKVAPLTYERVKSFATDYHVRWIACGNTMKTIGWTDKDMRPFAEYAKVGAAAVMTLQENGYAYIAW